MHWLRSLRSLKSFLGYFEKTTIILYSGRPVTKYQFRFLEQQQQLPQQTPSPQQSQQQQQNSHMQRMHNPAHYIQANNININNNYVPMGNCNELKQMRAQQQYRYVDRRSLFPPETKEEYYNGAMRQVNVARNLFITPKCWNIQNNSFQEG